MAFTGQQEEALKKVDEWFKNGSEQVFRLFGYAGTGKTTLARFFGENIKGHVQYGSFTGKACQVLRNKGCVNASTLHSMIYKPMRLPDGNVRFVKDPASPALSGAKLVIVDEVSMVGEELAKDLLSYGVKVLVLGDPAQLPPVKSEGFFTNAKPDYMLTEVHRQAEGNPILKLSMDIRAGKKLKHGDYGDLMIVKPGDLSVKEVLSFDQVICGKNASRMSYNRRIRQFKGFSGVLPMPMEKLICLKNNSTNGLFNGQMWQVTEISPVEEETFDEEGRKLPPHLKLFAKSLDDNGLVSTIVLKECFEGSLKDFPWYTVKLFDEFAFGYAITCHKSQGSQWDSVLVFDESYVFQADARRWQYTAITRAAKKLTIVL